MSFGRYQYTIIYSNGTQSKGVVGAISEGEAYSKAEATARCSAAGRDGGYQIIIDRL